MHKILSDDSDLDTLMTQEARIFRTGNSLAIRIPIAITKRLALQDGVAVEIAANRKVMYVRKAPSERLADLIDRITPENIHEPVFEKLVGAERW